MKREDIQKLALDAIKGKQRAGLALATGVGKTLVGLTHLEENISLLKNVLLVGPKKAVYTSWKDEAIKFNKSHLLNNVRFVTYLSLHKLDPNEFDIIYLDEAHSLLDSHREFLESYNGIILGLTGTPPKYKNGEKGMLMREFYPIQYEYLTDHAISDGILNDYKIIVHELTLDNVNKNVEAGSKYKKFFTTELANYNYWTSRLETATYGKSATICRIMRMKAMMGYPSKEKYTQILMRSIKSKTIVFANTQGQADLLCKHSFHSENDKSEENLKMFKEGQINVLSAVLQLSEGINIPKLKQGIILHAYGNERKAAQRIGRCLRLNPDETAMIHILCYKGTVDEKWVVDALASFDQSKIEWKNYNIKL
jgi:superfamily II DNA or RNA helicase